MSHPTPTFLTILTAPEHQPQRKTFRPGGADDPALGYRFRWREVEVADLDALVRVLDSLQAQPCDVPILGRVRDEVRDQRKILRRKRTDPITIEDPGSRVLHLDVDGMTLPAGSDWSDPAALARWAWDQIGLRFAPLGGVSCWWQASGSAGTPGKAHLAKFHFWVVTDAPMVEAERRRVLSAAGADDDCGCPIQKNYVAVPAFRGVPDPLAGRARSGVIAGRERMDTAAALRTVEEGSLQAVTGRQVAAVRAPVAVRTVEMPSDADLAQTRTTAQGREILDRACARIAATGQGARNKTIFREAAGIGRAIRDGLVGWSDAVERLVEAAEKSGTRRVEEPVANGLRAGLTEERIQQTVRRLGDKLRNLGAAEMVMAARTCPPADLPSRRQAALMTALQEAGRGDVDLPVVVAVALALGRGVPSRLGLDDLRQTLAQHAPDLAPAVLDAIVARVGWGVERRREDALRVTSLSDGTRRADDVAHQYVERLTAPPLAGVTLVRAPLGAGKTQQAIAPWVAQAKAAGGRVLAVCHRRSLVQELGRRLGLAHYESAQAWGEMEAAGGLSICSPSLTSAQWQHLGARWVVIDEVSQVLRFLGAESYCRTRSGTARDVWQRLVDLVRTAEGVIVADAHADDRTVDFLRYCRPDEKIEIVEQPEAADAGIEAEFLVGVDAYAEALARAGRVMTAGRAVWVACESAEVARDAGAWLGRFGRVLTVTADDKREAAQAAFLVDPEGESLRYDAVVASPVISSGLSVEHAGRHHFAEGFLLATGTAVTPADAAQMMRRVRYLRRFTVASKLSNLTGGRDADRTLAGREAAAEVEGKPALRGRFDRLVAGYDADDANARANFCNGLWWLLQAQGWRVTRGSLQAGASRQEVAGVMGEARAQRQQERADALVRACQALPDYSADQIDELRREGATGDNRRLVEAWQATLALGVPVLAVEDVEFLDAGGLGKLDMFDDLDGRGPVEVDSRDADAALMHRRLRVARARHLARIFAGFPVLGADPWLDDAAARVILDRIRQDADQMVASGAVPPRFGARFGGRDPAMPKQPVRAVCEILARGGVRMVATRPRSGPDDPQPSNYVAPHLDQQRATEGARGRVYCAAPATVAEMRERSRIRREAWERGGHPAHNAAAKAPENPTEIVGITPRDPAAQRRHDAEMREIALQLGIDPDAPVPMERRRRRSVEDAPAPRPDPEQERRARAARRREVIAAAETAAMRGNPDDALDMLVTLQRSRHLRADDPDTRAARRHVAALVERLQSPCPDDDLPAAVAALALGARIEALRPRLAAFA